MKTKIEQLKEAGFDVIEEESNEKQNYYAIKNLTLDNLPLYESIVTPLDYNELRKQEYPPLEDFADAFYHLQKGDKTKMDEYIARVESVKKKYPK